MTEIKNISTYEIERGKPTPSKNHSIIQANLIFELMKKYRNQYRMASELNLKMPSGDKVPDIVVYLKSELIYSPGQDEAYVSKKPFGIIEILSHSQNPSELVTRSHSYFADGIKSYWLAIPDLKSIYVFSAPNEYDVFSKKEKLVDGQLGIELDLGEIFK